MNRPTLNPSQQAGTRSSAPRQVARVYRNADSHVRTLRPTPADSRTRLSALLWLLRRDDRSYVSCRHNCFPGARALLLMLLVALGIGDLLAERYLSLIEAQQVCFPQADQFEAQTISLTPEESKAVEQKSGAKVRARESRIWVALKGTNLLGLLVLDNVLGKHEAIEYAVALSPKGTVLQVEILEYREHYGGEIRNAKWRDQFKGKTAGAKLKLNDDIYNISGATISCRNVTNGVRRVLATFELVVRPRLLAAGRLQDRASKP